MTNVSSREVLRRLFDWASEQDFAGHDPHDLLEAPVLSRVKRPLMRLIALQLGRRSMIDFRSFLKVPTARNPKGLALFLTGLLEAKELVTSNWKEQASALGDRLVELIHDEGGWGYPFAWQSRTHFIARGTPNIVTTSFVANALIDLYNLEPSSTTLETIKRACDYITRDIPRTDFPQGVAFGYAKDDPQVVFNASLLGASVLAKAGVLLANQDYLQFARRAAWVVMEHQRADGSWIYGLEPTQTWIDAFHTGFVLISLRDIASILGDETMIAAAERGFEFYQRTFVESDFAVRYYDRKRYPIDAHAVGQSLVTLSTFGKLDTARKVAHWAIQHLWSDRGYFYYQLHRTYTNRIAYMRWSNAWMFRGLAALEAASET